MILPGLKKDSPLCHRNARSHGARAGLAQFPLGAVVADVEPEHLNAILANLIAPR
jgi:hypothetical protein